MITPRSYYICIPDFTLMVLNARNQLFRAEVLIYVGRQRVYVVNCSNTLLSYPVVFTRWVPPIRGIWKLTLDGFVSQNAGVGGFLRNWYSKIEPVFQGKMEKIFDYCDTDEACYEAELYAVYYCLNTIFETHGEDFCRKMRLTIECDNLRVVKALRTGVFPLDSSFEIKHSTVAELMDRFEYCCCW
ncbi:uncharacterized protein LOC132278843 [Cornus florida]|uniref:uncharacterized protein LOC132278843 n=1 Tax=Cornus florida TaxID=4283 RepID=UPI00289D1ED9|nr:uncharacterized protein LOC132278843 [Cornus florida]XP_059636725.1 uncharacterized protein LOC132278843 [Cornus florida]XP_059636726.1 uncharacterized protein LOC132278843 [Cornus florida]XP_059636727.1 uncharacterized protein LOC132278843 [Cornus florida]XP_059636728.1 uncharacterized protein LOC132278843 [Cornus florida]